MSATLTIPGVPGCLGNDRLSRPDARKLTDRFRLILLIIGSVDDSGGMADVDSITDIYGVISNG